MEVIRGPLTGFQGKLVRKADGCRLVGTRRGVGKNLAAQTAGSLHNVWRISRSPAMSLALPNRGWERLGLPRLSAGVR